MKNEKNRGFVNNINMVQTIITESEMQKPSDYDIDHAQAPINFVLSNKDSKVYFYNKETKLDKDQKYGSVGNVDINIFTI